MFCLSQKSLSWILRMGMADWPTWPSHHPQCHLGSLPKAYVHRRKWTRCYGYTGWKWLCSRWLSDCLLRGSYQGYARCNLPRRGWLAWLYDLGLYRLWFQLEQAKWTSGMALSMWIEIMLVMEASNVARRNPSTGTRMSLLAMVQALSRAHLFTIFIKSSPYFIICEKEFN